ncbi:MAG: histidine phosphatase family protein [Acidimicrobiales bacterium]
MRPATTLLLVRHGRTATTGRELPAPTQELDGRGHAQAAAVAEALAALSPTPTALYTSPLVRCRQTAAPIARALGQRARLAAGVRECDYGEWTGQPLSRLRRLAAWRAVVTTPSTVTFPGGESLAAMSQRMWATLLDLAARHRGERVVVVSHADPIRAALAVAQGVPLDLFGRTVVAPASISVVRLGETPAVLALNLTDLAAVVGR